RPRLGLSPRGGEVSFRFPEQESYARGKRQFKAESAGEPAGCRSEDRIRVVCLGVFWQFDTG
ncbi:MAG: hypothetical protein ACKO9H_10195, partial [Planctomycetota bacterium]